MLTRRDLLKKVSLVSGLSILPLGHYAWALAGTSPSKKRMIVVMMRGAVDGLSIVTPFMEKNYYNSRALISLAPPGTDQGLINLDGFFGLHPSLESMMPLWTNKNLAFIHASGSPSETRSHFEAQDIMETAVLNTALSKQGWMNGLAEILPSNHSATQWLSFGNVLPKIFQGEAHISTVPTNLGNKIGYDSDNKNEGFSQLYSSKSELSSLYNQAVSARASMSQDLQSEMINANKGAPVGDAFINQCHKAASLMSHDTTVQLVFMDVGGWDTHVNQGNAKGALANRLEKLGVGLSNLALGLGDSFKDTVILVMSEFGRTVAENGNGGTDHGHGNVAWLLGGNINGGKVYGKWPGLNPDQLWQGRDLAATTDFRSIVGMVISDHLGIEEARLGKIIPNYVHDVGLDKIII